MYAIESIILNHAVFPLYNTTQLNAHFYKLLFNF